MQHSTIALFASARRNGNTGRLMDRIAQELDIEVIDLATKNIAAYDYEHSNRHDDFEPLMERILAFDRIIFASPVYWYGVSGPMKIFLDRVSDYLDLPELKDKGRGLRGKSAYILATSVRPEIHTAYLSAYESTFRYLGMRLEGYLHADCADGYREERYEDDARQFIRKLRPENVLRESSTPA
jgi:multimeric flavodoxin WrbA